MNQASDVPSIGFQYRLSMSPYGNFFFIACFRYWVELIMRRRKNSRTSGRTIPSPKHILQTPTDVRSSYAERTMRATIPAKTKPRSIAKSVDIATRIPRLFRAYSPSSLASVEPVAQTGYSPPAPASVSLEPSNGAVVLHTESCYTASNNPADVEISMASFVSIFEIFTSSRTTRAATVTGQF